MKIGARARTRSTLTLQGVPASVAFVVPGGSVLISTSGSAFTMPKCAAAAQLDVYAVDADGYLILGAGAPAISRSCRTRRRSSFRPRVQRRGARLRSRAAPRFPTGGSTVDLTAKATPSKTSGAKSQVAQPSSRSIARSAARSPNGRRRRRIAIPTVSSPVLTARCGSANKRSAKSGAFRRSAR